MTSELRAIETVYQGFRFRSRTEARWAVFFDQLNVKWQYEVEGFELRGGIRYLPDFWLPDHRCFIEIKGERATAEEQAKAWLLAADSARDVCIFDQPDFAFPHYTCHADGAGTSQDGAWGDMVRIVRNVNRIRTPVYWGECRLCADGERWIGIQGTEATNMHNYDAHHREQLREAGAPQLWSASERLGEAYGAARAARFEFGESGAAPAESVAERLRRRLAPRAT